MCKYLCLCARDRHSKTIPKDRLDFCFGQLGLNQPYIFLACFWLQVPLLQATVSMYFYNLSVTWIKCEGTLLPDFLPEFIQMGLFDSPSFQVYFKWLLSLHHTSPGDSNLCSVLIGKILNNHKGFTWQSMLIVISQLTTVLYGTSLSCLCLSIWSRGTPPSLFSLDDISSHSESQFSSFAVNFKEDYFL